MNQEQIHYEQWWLWYDTLCFPGYHRRTLHPIAFAIKQQKRDHYQQNRIAIMPPIYDIYHLPGLTNHNMLQIFDFSSIDNQKDSTSTDNDLAIFPLFWYGWGETDKDRYWAIFPFYGNIKGKLGFDYIHFTLFPIYASYGNQTNAYHAKSWFYPIYMRGKSADRDELRIFPFYSHSLKQGRYARYRYLWPLLLKEDNNLGSKTPERVRMFLPFYGVKTKGKSHARYVLYPLFSWGADPSSGSKHYNILWPLIQISDMDNPRLYKRFYFPFYGIYEFENKKSRYITPFYFEMQEEKEYSLSRQTYILPLIWSSQRFRKENKSKAYESQKSIYSLKFWPIFHYWRNYESGEYEIQVLSPLIYRSDNSIFQAYHPFWTLYSNSKLNAESLRKKTPVPVRLSKKPQTPQQNFHYQSYFFRLYSRWQSNGHHNWQIPFFIGYRQNDQGAHYLLFAGLWKISVDKE